MRLKSPKHWIWGELGYRCEKDIERIRRIKLATETEKPAKQVSTTAEAKKPQQYIWGLGRRKTAVARVRIAEGEGNVLINKRSVEDYFTEDEDRKSVYAPLEATDTRGQFNVWANVQGGGSTGQSGAVLLGIARALVKAEPDLESALRAGGYLTRDPRMVERKKYGQRGARRRFQFSKR
ncbi:MAG: 30S ribosomal protein S9 [Actinobacteria bacterium]|nr:30S ribosomal protein S9 [Actinomycetota bacterium]